jgi:hypothetical protein
MPGTKMAIDSLESIQAGDARQWIRIRAAACHRLTADAREESTP